MQLQAWWDWRLEDESWKEFLIPRLPKTCDEWCNPVLSLHWGPVNISWWYKFNEDNSRWFLMGAMGMKQHHFVSPDYTAWAIVKDNKELEDSWDRLETDDDWHPPLWTMAQLIEAGATFESFADEEE